MRVASMGHAVFAAAMISVGVLGLIQGNFVAVWDPAPKGLPAREVLVYLCAIISLASGIGLLLRRTAALAARVLLVASLLWLLLLRVRDILVAPTAQGSWSACGETAVTVAAAWLLYGWFAIDGNRQSPGLAADKGIRIARVLFGLALIPFGWAHFTYPKATAGLVPGWLPWHLAWTYFFGCTFIAAGLGVVIGVYARLAAALSALQMGMFAVLVWIPIVAAAGPKRPYQWSETIDSFALMAGAWVVAESYRGTSWLAMPRLATNKR